MIAIADTRTRPWSIGGWPRLSGTQDSPLIGEPCAAREQLRGLPVSPRQMQRPVCAMSAAVAALLLAAAPAPAAASPIPPDNFTPPKIQRAGAQLDCLGGEWEGQD